IMVRSESFEVRMQAVYLVGRLGAHAAGSAPILKWLARDRREQEALRDPAIASIGAGLGSRCAPFLFGLLANWRSELSSLSGRAAYTMLRSVSPDVLRDFREVLSVTSSAFVDGHRGNAHEWEKEQMLSLLVRIAEVEPVLAGRVRHVMNVLTD